MWMVYVGQSSDLAKRLSQHIAGKDWWDSAIILTTKDDSLLTKLHNHCRWEQLLPADLLHGNDGFL